MELARLVGQNVRRQRQARGLSQEALAFDAGIQRSYLNEMESGKRNPTLGVVERVARALGIPATDLFKLDELFTKSR